MHQLTLGHVSMELFPGTAILPVNLFVSCPSCLSTCFSPVFLPVRVLPLFSSASHVLRHFCLLACHFFHPTLPPVISACELFFFVVSASRPPCLLPFSSPVFFVGHIFPEKTEHAVNRKASFYVLVIMILRVLSGCAFWMVLEGEQDGTLIWNATALVKYIKHKRLNYVHTEAE